MILALLFLITAAFAEEPSSDAGDAPAIKRSWVPILGYNPTYRIFVGGGFFFEKQDLKFGIHGVVTQDRVKKAEIDWGNRLNPRWRYNFNHEIGDGFEPYYGEGSRTRVEDRVDLIFAMLKTRAYLIYEADSELSFGPFMDVRIRRNEEMAVKAGTPMSRREDQIAVGVFQELDYRNLEGSPTFGWYERVTALTSPRQEGQPSFTMLDLDLRFFQQMNETVVLAIQLAGGVAAGTPTYLFESYLGGTDRLRGYHVNRFRGKKYYVEQTEFRFPIWKFISAVSFLEFGEATNDRFENPNASYGLGLRLGLPPDYLSQVRIDMAWGKDQRGLFLDFGHAF